MGHSRAGKRTGSSLTMRERGKLKDGCDGTLDASMYIPQPEQYST